MAKSEKEILGERRKKTIPLLIRDGLLFVLSIACMWLARDRFVDIIGGEDNLLVCYGMGIGVLGFLLMGATVAMWLERCTHLSDEDKYMLEIDRRLDAIEWRLEHGCGPEEKSISELERRVKELERHRYE